MPSKNSSPVSNIKLLNHPSIAPKIDLLRDRKLSPSTVRSLTTELSYILAHEGISTLDPTTNKKIVLIVVLRAGLPMCDPFLASLPPNINVAVYHLGLYREKKTLEPVEYYNKLPHQSLAVDQAFVVDPLIATGGTAIATIDILKAWGVKHVTYLSILATQQGMETVAKAWPEGTDFVVGHLDEGVDETGRIYPGVGDIGDRLYGTENL